MPVRSTLKSLPYTLVVLFLWKLIRQHPGTSHAWSNVVPTRRLRNNAGSNVVPTKPLGNNVWSSGGIWIDIDVLISVHVVRAMTVTSQSGLSQSSVRATVRAQSDLGFSHANSYWILMLKGPLQSALPMTLTINFLWVSCRTCRTCIELVVELVVF